MTILGRVNHHGTELGTHLYSAWAIPPRAAAISDALARIHGLTMLAGVWLRTSLTEISAKVWEAVAHWRLFEKMCCTNPRLLYLLTYLVGGLA